MLTGLPSNCRTTLCMTNLTITFNWSRCLSELSEGDKTNEGQKRAKEALTTLDKVNHKFKENANVKLQSMLIESRVHLGQDNDRKATEVLSKAMEFVDQIELKPEDHLELARTLYAKGQVDKAENPLMLAQSHGQDRNIMNQIEDLLDEPVSLKKKMKARTLNKEGITLLNPAVLMRRFRFSKKKPWRPRQNILRLTSTLCKCFRKW